MNPDGAICIYDCTILIKSKPQAYFPDPNESFSFIRYVHEKKPKYVAVYLHAEKEDVIIHCVGDEDKFFVYVDIDEGGYRNIIRILNNFGYEILYKLKRG